MEALLCLGLSILTAHEKIGNKPLFDIVNKLLNILAETNRDLIDIE